MYLKMTDIAFILVLAIISLINHNFNLFLYGVACYLVGYTIAKMEDTND